MRPPRSQAFPAPFIDHHQRPKAAPAQQRVVNEIDRPGVVNRLRPFPHHPQVAQPLASPPPSPPHRGSSLNGPVALPMSLSASFQSPPHRGSSRGLPPEKRFDFELESVTERRRTNAGESVQRRADHRDIARA